MNKTILSILVLASFSYGVEPSVALKSYMLELQNQAKILNPNFLNFDAKIGKDIFFQKQIVDGKEISCTTCHTKNLGSQGLNSKTNKIIDPLSPSVNRLRLTDVKEIKKWLKRNFNDVYKREGTAQEKGNVLAFILKN